LHLKLPCYYNEHITLTIAPFTPYTTFGYQECYNAAITSKAEKEHEVLVEGPAIYKPKTKIRELRHQKFMTMQELAEEAGVAFQTVVRVEHGNPAKAGTIRKLAKALGVEPSELAD
jgi:DNA-binding XRE family transcriptional regulator